MKKKLLMMVKVMETMKKVQEATKMMKKKMKVKRLNLLNEKSGPQKKKLNWLSKSCLEIK